MAFTKENAAAARAAAQLALAAKTPEMRTEYARRAGAASRGPNALIRGLTRCVDQDLLTDEHRAQLLLIALRGSSIGGRS
jgi:hypothetical protein